MTLYIVYTRSSQSIEAARKRAPNRRFLDKLKFSELDNACVHGGREYKSKATQRCSYVAIVTVHIM